MTTDLQQYVLQDKRFKQILEQVDEKERELFINVIQEFISKLSSVNAAYFNNASNINSGVNINSGE